MAIEKAVFRAGEAEHTLHKVLLHDSDRNENVEALANWIFGTEENKKWNVINCKLESTRYEFYME